jgi:hypothetical protein
MRGEVIMRVPTFSALPAAVLLCGVAALAVDAAGGQKGDPTADPAAYALLKEAHDRREAFPAGFSGLSADVAMNDNGNEVKGSLTYTSSGDLKLTLSDASKQQEDWAREQLGSALAHRRQDDFVHGDGSHPLTFVPDDRSPLGRQIALNDRFKSSYRVKDGHITEVTRSMGALRFTITVLEDRSVEGGKYLPSQFIVTYFDAATGTIKQVDAYSDHFVKVSNAWVPSARRVVTAENGGFTTRTLALNNIHLLGTTSAAKR